MGKWMIVLFFSFGGGRSTCPAKKSVGNLLFSLTEVLMDNYDIVFTKSIFSTRLFATFVTPPFGVFTVKKR